MFRFAVIAAVILMSILLMVSTFFSGLRDTSLLGFAQAATGVLVTLHLLRALRRGKVPPGGQAAATNPHKNARAIALGFAIAIVAPILVLWWITTSAGPR